MSVKGRLLEWGVQWEGGWLNEKVVGVKMMEVHYVQVWNYHNGSQWNIR
jgi:hypothetical protein